MTDINKILKKPFYNGTSPRGAQFGRSYDFPDDVSSFNGVIYIQNVKIEDGYDNGGAYWGSPSNILCAFSADESIMYFFRADKRATLGNEILSLLSKIPNCEDIMYGTKSMKEAVLSGKWFNE